MPQIRKKLNAARKALAKVLTTKKATEKQKEAASKKVEELQKKFDDNYAAYRALPEEFDAWAVGDDATTEWILWERE
jgi:predicted  nucleic acid-binding Zn-ribbon protein